MAALALVYIAEDRHGPLPTQKVEPITCTSRQDADNVGIKILFLNSQFVCFCVCNALTMFLLGGLVEWAGRIPAIVWTALMHNTNIPRRMFTAVLY
jgi:hypothetical protein